MLFSERGQAYWKWVIYGLIIVFAVFSAVSVASGFIMDYYWFQSVGYLQVFMTNIKYQLLLLFLSWIVTTVCLLLSWRTVRKSLEDQLPPIGNTLFKVFSVFIGFVVGWWLKGKYLVVLKYLNQTAWGVADPVFGHDVSFYVFTLPMLKTALAFIGVVSGLVFFTSVLIYGIVRVRLMEGEGFEYKDESTGENSLWEPSRFFKSWPVIGSIMTLIGVAAVSVWLGRFSYLWDFSPGAQVPTGASYMAVRYLIPYTWAKALGVILVGFLVYRVFFHLDDIRDRIEFGDWGALKKEMLLILAVLLIFLVIPGVLFGAIDTLNVEPNEPRIQRPYIENTIYYTNQAYSLDEIQDITYPTSTENLTTEEALGSPTVRNARIVDYRPIKESFEQKQTLRTYYTFPDVDVDRYQISAEKKLAVISGREMNYEGGG